MLRKVWDWLNTPVQMPGKKRAFSGALGGRLMADWVASGTSQDSEIYASLVSLRNRSRQLCRDNDYAKGAVRTIVQNVVHRGIKLQAQVKRPRGAIDSRLNSEIEAAFKEWCCREYCHVAGKLSFHDIERLAMRSCVESGEVILRLVRQSFGGSRVPLAIEIIESDQLAEDHNGEWNGNEIRMGVEIDYWGRPTAYWVRDYHPGDFQFAPHRGRRLELTRIPASEILHIYVSDRPGQTRGVPWLHSALTRLRNLGGYEEAELIAARVGACSMGFIQSGEIDLLADEPDDGSGKEPIKSFQPGQIEVLAPGETFQGYAPTRPNEKFDAFMRAMLRGVASGLGMSYESLSRDYSQSNYSSSRLALLDDRDHYRMLQDWLVDSLHRPLYRAWLDMAVLAGAVKIPAYELDPMRFQAHHFQARGWGWVDPAKEVKSTVESIRSGITTLTDVATANGTDLETLLETRARELELAASLGLTFAMDGSLGQEQPEVEEPQVGSEGEG